MMNFKEMSKKNSRIKIFLANEDGQGMVEYGLILGLVAIICIAIITSLGTTIYDFFFGKMPSIINTNTNK